MTKYINTLVRYLNTKISMVTGEMDSSYEVAVRALNTLQSNASVLEKLRREKGRITQLSLPEMIRFAERADITLDRLDELSVIHVSGTKGKGSTCAFCESILRSHGYKTGFFSSPHLVEVRERIRINGQPLSRDAFSHFFWECFSKFNPTKDSPDVNRPAYFRFLTIMAFHVFLQEKVDVAILEVGIGGTDDSTNIIRSPVVCGISSLDIDHTNALGNTLQEIAGHKAGIIKPGVPVVTVQQPENCNDIITKRAAELNSALYMAPPLDQYKWPDDTKAGSLGIPGDMQVVNASLALQLARIWMLRDGRGGMMLNDDIIRSNNLGQAYVLSDEDTAGLRDCQWAGRSQTIARPGITYYVDGAHTARSMQACVRWFKQASCREAALLKKPVWKVLVFNCTGGRPAERLLQELVPCKFDTTVFCPNIVDTTSEKADMTNYTVATTSQQKACIHNQSVWHQLSDTRETKPTKVCDGHSANYTNGYPEIKLNGSGDRNPPLVNGFHKIVSGESDDCPEATTREIDSSTQSDTFVFSSIAECLRYAAQGRDPVLGRAFAASARVKSDVHLQVLCTGSMHLVGGVLSVLQPGYAD